MPKKKRNIENNLSNSHKTSCKLSVRGKKGDGTTIDDNNVKHRKSRKEIVTPPYYSDDDEDDTNSTSDSDGDIFVPERKRKITVDVDSETSDTSTEAESDLTESSYDATSDTNSDSESESESDPESDSGKKKSRSMKLGNGLKSMIMPIIKPKLRCNSNEIFQELIRKQLPNVPYDSKLHTSDMKRICKYIESSIFHPTDCCLWKGYITNVNNFSKGTYVNFYFRNKKVALHRLLYTNFVAPLDSGEYLKFNCDHKGVCCNINHYEKYKYSKNSNTYKKEPKKEVKKEAKDLITIGTSDPTKLIIDFE
jgi:hypothetical protein